MEFWRRLRGTHRMEFWFAIERFGGSLGCHVSLAPTSIRYGRDGQQQTTPHSNVFIDLNNQDIFIYILRGDTVYSSHSPRHLFIYLPSPSHPRESSDSNHHQLTLPPNLPPHPHPPRPPQAQTLAPSIHYSPQLNMPEALQYSTPSKNNRGVIICICILHFQNEGSSQSKSVKVSQIITLQSHPCYPAINHQSIQTCFNT